MVTPLAAVLERHVEDPFRVGPIARDGATSEASLAELCDVADELPLVLSVGVFAILGVSCVFLQDHVLRSSSFGAFFGSDPRSRNVSGPVELQQGSPLAGRDFRR